MSATHGAVSAVLMTERGTVQTPVYFISRTLQGPLNYTPIEKTTTKMKRHAGRTQYHLPTKDVSERTNLADFLIEKPDESPSDTSVVETPQEPKNKKADALSKIASTSFAYLSKHVLVEILKEKSIHEKEVTNVVEEDGLIWMTPIIEYLKEGTLPNDRKEASKLRIKAIQYELLEGILYRRSFLKPWLRCAGPLQADYVIHEIHEGSCNMYAGPWSVVAKAMRLGYYWPTMHRDAREMIRTCKNCQIHHPMPRNP
ncbi:reverse transcriptase domain-containing protein [Tanacetum coccineum]